MARYDFRSQRLFVELALAEGGDVPLDAAQANYLVNVLRLKPGASVLVFNGRDGEWRAELGGHRQEAGCPRRHRAHTRADRARRSRLPVLAAQARAPRLHGAEGGRDGRRRGFQPIIMRHTQAERVNLGRMRANAIEAAEQCGILDIPEIAEPRKFDALVRGWKPDRLLVFCDEEADVKDPVAALSSARGGGLAGPLPVSVLVGPEGGFAEDERAALLQAAQRCAACARTAHPARRYRRGRGADAGPGGARRLALNAPPPGTKSRQARFRSPQPDGIGPMAARIAASLQPECPAVLARRVTCRAVREGAHDFRNDIGTGEVDHVRRIQVRNRGRVFPGRCRDQVGCARNAADVSRQAEVRDRRTGDGRNAAVAARGRDRAAHQYQGRAHRTALPAPDRRQHRGRAWPRDSGGRHASDRHMAFVGADVRPSATTS